MNSVRSNNLSLKYQRLETSGCKDIGMRKFEFVAKTQFLRIVCYKYTISIQFIYRVTHKGWDIKDRLYGLYTIFFLNWRFYFPLNLNFFFANSLSTPMKNNIKDWRLNWTFRSTKIKSFQSPFKSHSAWVTLYSVQCTLFRNSSNAFDIFIC